MADPVSAAFFRLEGALVSSLRVPAAAWLAAGCHGDMDYMAHHAALRADPATLLPGALRVITTHLEYYARAHREAQIDRLLALHAEACAPHLRVTEPGSYESFDRSKTALVCGDFNVARTDMDVHPKERKPAIIGQLPEERDQLERILDRGALDGPCLGE